MPNFFYLDANGQKQGPVTPQQLKALATQGAITPSTQLATDGGHKGTAGQIKGLFAAVEDSPFTVAAPSSVDMPAVEGHKSSLVVTLVGVLAIAVVGGIGWFVVSGTSSPGSLQSSPSPARQAVVNPPVERVPEVAAVPYQPKLWSEEEMRKRLAFANQHYESGNSRSGKLIKNDANIEEIIRWLLRVQEAGLSIDHHFDKYIGTENILNMLKWHDENYEKYGGFNIDQYDCNTSYLKRYKENQGYTDKYADKIKVLESMLSESNRLSGNKHDKEEEARLAGKDLFK